MSELNDEFIERMEDVLELYARPFKRTELVVALDERPVQLLDLEREGIPMRPEQPKRTDYEYVRRGIANVFCVVEPLTGDRMTRATRNAPGHLSRKCSRGSHVASRSPRPFTWCSTI